MIGLTPRLKQVAALAAAGMTNEEIAKETGITSTAANRRLERAYRIVGVKGHGNPRVRLALLWRDKGGAL